jgi:hypothetical protein
MAMLEDENWSGEDRMPIELFVASVRDWDTGLRRFLDHLTDVNDCSSGDALKTRC